VAVAAGTSQMANRGGTVNVAIVYDSRTGTTKAAAEAMKQMADAAGYECSAVPVDAASPEAVAAAGAVCIGSWTEGLFFFRQHATQKTMDFIDRLSLDGAPAAVFCTYKTSPGKMLDKMAAALEGRGARVTGSFRSKGPEAPDGFSSWLSSLSEG
jgi:flavodoxin